MNGSLGPWLGAAETIRGTSVRVARKSDLIRDCGEHVGSDGISIPVCVDPNPAARRLAQIAVAYAR